MMTKNKHTIIFSLYLLLSSTLYAKTSVTDTSRTVEDYYEIWLEQTNEQMRIDFEKTKEEYKKMQEELKKQGKEVNEEMAIRMPSIKLNPPIRVKDIENNYMEALMPQFLLSFKLWKAENGKEIFVLITSSCLTNCLSYTQLFELQEDSLIDITEDIFLKERQNQLYKFCHQESNSENINEIIIGEKDKTCWQSFSKEGTSIMIGFTQFLSFDRENAFSQQAMQVLQLTAELKFDTKDGTIELLKD